MCIITKVIVKKHQKAVVYKDDSPDSVLSEGIHYIFHPFVKCKVSLYSLTNVRYIQDDAEIIEQHYPALAKHFEFIRTSDTSLVFVRREGILMDIIPPGSFRAYWNLSEPLQIETIDLNKGYECDLSKFGNTAEFRNAAIRNGYIVVEGVPSSHIGLLYINGEFIKVLEPGNYGFWKFNEAIQVKKIDTRTQSVDIGGQEILTKDKVTIRINLSINYQIMDHVKVSHELSDYSDYIYRQSQFVLREAVGTRTLDDMLADKQALNEELSNSLEARFQEYGIDLKGVNIRDIILPGEIREIFNKIVEMEKASRANVVKRQEETAATRSLLNTAKLIDSNPTLLRLKELESLEKVTDKIDNINVYNGLQGVLSELVKLRPE